MLDADDIHREIRKNADTLENVVAILKASKDSNLAKMKIEDGALPLHLAGRNGNGVIALVRLLVKMNPEGTRTQNDYGNLPIHITGPPTEDRYKYEAREFLLKEYPEGSKVQNIDRELPIHCMAKCGDSKTTKLLLEEYPEGLKAKDKDGWLPIHHACFEGHETIRLLVDAFPAGMQLKNNVGNLPIHEFVAGLTKVDAYELFTIDMLAGTSSGAFDISCTCKGSLLTCDCYSPHPIIRFLDESKFPKYRSRLVSVLLKHSQKQKNRGSAQNANHITELESKVENVALKKERELSAAIIEKNKKYKEQLVASNKKCKEQLEQVSYLKEQVKHAKKEKAENQMNKKRVVQLSEDNNKYKEHLKESKVKLEQKKKQVASWKEQAEHDAEKQQAENQRNKKHVAEVNKDNKKYEEQLKQIQEKLEQEQQQTTSLKEQIGHAEKRIQSFELARKSESKLLSKLLETNDDWTIQDLKSIAESLNTRLDALRTQFEANSRRSVTQKFLSYLLNDAAPSKEDLLQTIETIDSELSEVESAVAGLSTSEDTLIPEANRSLNESPENATRKRAWVSISPA